MNENELHHDASIMDAYLRLLGASIRVYPEVNTNQLVTPKMFVNSRGWGTEREGYSWTSRAERWYIGRDTNAYRVWDGSIQTKLNVHQYKDHIPIFKSMLEKAKKAVSVANRARGGIVSGRQQAEQVAKQVIETHNERIKITGDCIVANTITQRFKPLEEKTMLNKAKRTADRMVDVNKDAGKVAANIAVGRTANTFFLNKLVGKLPWYAKFFGGKKKVEDNALAKLASAETAAVLIKHFAPDNQKLNYIAQGMITDAVVDVTVNSNAFEKLINELEGLVTLPDFDSNKE